jgi:hypothetical protein
MISNIVFFILGCLAGWITNHWYSVNLRQPSLRINGGGNGSNFQGSGHPYTNITVENELRYLRIQLPITIIVGRKQLKTHFGNQVVERESAQQCIARLLDKSGRHICQLWWLIDTKVDSITEIKSGKSVNLLLFIKGKNNAKEYYAYQPISSSNIEPKISGTPKFNKTMDFLVEISYSYGTKKIQFPVRVVINYDGSFSFETNNGSGTF